MIALKLFVFAKRLNSSKGEKDFLDLISLFENGMNNPDLLTKVIKEYNMQSCVKKFEEKLLSSTEIMELELNKHRMKKVKEIILALTRLGK